MKEKIKQFMELGAGINQGSDPLDGMRLMVLGGEIMQALDKNESLSEDIFEGWTDKQRAELVASAVLGVISTVTGK
jgi:hypothetical protein